MAGGQDSSRKKEGWSAGYSAEGILVQLQTFLFDDYVHNYDGAMKNTLWDRVIEEGSGRRPAVEVMSKLYEAAFACENFKCSKCGFCGKKEEKKTHSTTNGGVVTEASSSSSNPSPQICPNAISMPGLVKVKDLVNPKFLTIKSHVPSSTIITGSAPWSGRVGSTNTWAPTTGVLCEVYDRVSKSWTSSSLKEVLKNFGTEVLVTPLNSDFECDKDKETGKEKWIEFKCEVEKVLDNGKKFNLIHVPFLHESNSNSASLFRLLNVPFIAFFDEQSKTGVWHNEPAKKYAGMGLGGPANGFFGNDNLGQNSNSTTLSKKDEIEYALHEDQAVVKSAAKNASTNSAAKKIIVPPKKIATPAPADAKNVPVLSLDKLVLT